jgi:1-acyl-sn-glycerol-3-phosphate acyltransferase
MSDMDHVQRRRHRWLRRTHRRRPSWPRTALICAAGPLVRRLFRLQIEGDDRLPPSGPAIIAANHLSFFDHIALIVAVRRRLNFVGKAEYLDSWRTRRLLPALGMIPVDRANPRRALGALEQAAGVLEGDELFAIYPEGTRSRDGALQSGHTGVGHLSATTGAPIIPTGIVGTDRIQPPGARLPRPFTPAVVRFGTPIDPTAYHGTRRERRRRITSDVMHAIGQLTGQRHENASWTVNPPAGETLHIDERVVVSPSAGVFTPLTAEGSRVEVGQRIGHVRTGTETVAVRTPFTGRLMAMAAWEGERVDRCQRVAWIRRRDEPGT